MATTTDGNLPPINPFDTGLASQQDPRRFIVVHCDRLRDVRRQQLERSKRTGFIAGLEKVAGIEGLGEIQEGLSAIVKATGVGGSDWERIVNGGVEGVLTTVMGSQATNILTGAMEKINPGAVNKGMSTAEIIYDKVKQGDFNWRDIPQYLADFKNLWTLGEMIVDPFLTSSSASAEPRVTCSASPYAMDLVAQGVKHKFLFVVEIKFYKEYQQLLGVEPSFVVKTADRPSIVYEYEDLNLYNFKTKVIKKAQFTPCSMTFHDDEQNRAVAFYNAMMRIMSPITNHITPSLYEQTGMEFEDVTTQAVGRDSPVQGIAVYDHAASIGPLLKGTSVIEAINLYHVYLGGKKVNRYTFHKPKIMNMSLDQLDMSSADATELKIEFAFDNIEIVNNDVSALPMSMRDREDGSMYPLGGYANQPGDFQSDIVEKGSSSGFGGLIGGTMAELYAKGESFVEGAASAVGGWASDALGSATSFAAPPTAPLDTSPIQQSISYEQKAQQIRDLGIPGLSVSVLKYNK